MIKGFNGIRAIAVLMVLVTHFKLTNYQLFHKDISSISSGTTGVNIFFCLSGFLITYILIKEYKNHQTINIKNFLIRRALRLLPAMLTYCLVLTLLMFFGYAEPNWQSILYALTYTTNFSLKEFYNVLLYHFWSLSVEEHFYLFYPLLFKLNRRKNMIFILSGLVVISLAVKVLQVNYILYFRQLTENYRWTIPAILPILTGAIMSILLSFRGIKDKLESKKKVLFVFGILFFMNEIIVANSYIYKFGLNYLFQAIGVAFIITYISLNQGSVLVKFLEFRPLRFIGKISYGLYIWHVLLCYFVFSYGLNLYIGIVLSFVVSIFSYFSVEKYFLNKKMLYNNLETDGLQKNSIVC